MFDTMPAKCICCNGKVVYGKMQNFGIKPFQSGYCYICESCGAYVGTHYNRPKEALGILADAKTRRMRVLCHEEFEKHYMSSTGRNQLYYRLSKELGIKKDDCHFGYMNYSQLERALNIMKNWKDVYYR